jgi:hypothetical protein
MPRQWRFHVTKECSEYKGLAGDFCTITSSNLEEIAVGSKAVYADVSADPDELWHREGTYSFS